MYSYTRDMNLESFYINGKGLEIELPGIWQCYAQ